jgi:hypothetical protein
MQKGPSLFLCALPGIKKPARTSPAGCACMAGDLLFSCSFSLGSLECVDDFLLLDFALYVTGEVAVSVFPLKLGLRIRQTEFAGRELLDFFAAFTLGDNLKTGASVIGAARLAHEKAFDALLGCLTNHSANNLLSSDHGSPP